MSHLRSRRFLLWSTAAVAIVVLAAGLGVYVSVRGQKTAPSLTYDGLMARLRTAGATVAPGESVEQPFLAVPGRFLNINGTDVQVFEYASTNAARGDVARVAPDGCAVGNTIHINWIAPPHFYKQGRLIVIYIGSDTSILSVLSTALGPQFAGATSVQTPACP